jgi:hypothetical protein
MDWGPGTDGVTSPVTFDQFDPSLGTLLAIDLTLSTTIRNDYTLTFLPTPIPTTLYLATSSTSDPSILTDPAKRAALTDGPTVTVFGPDGSSQIFGAPGTTQPVDLLQMTRPSGTFSSLLPITDPNFIPPTITQQSFSRTLDPTNAGLLFSDFLGTGTVDLRVTATAFSSFFSDSGNGGGAVLTAGQATVTLQYRYLQAVVPEPSTVLLLGQGAALGVIVWCIRRRGASRST